MNFNIVNPAIPVQLNFHMVILVLKCARVARLLPSATVLEISNSANFYWYVERLNPIWHCKKIRDRRQQAKRLKEDMEAKKNSGLVRRGSWGGLEIAALAAVKLNESSKKKDPFIVRKCHKLLQWSGLVRNDRVELNRHIAATKIQRAWRNRLARPVEARSEDGAGAFIGIGGGDNHTDGGGGMDDTWRTSRTANGSTTLERTMRKRSTLGQQNNCAKSIRGRPSGTNNNVRPYRPSGTGKADNNRDSQVGSAMAEVTGQRVATVILISLILTIFFTYAQRDSSRSSTMVVLHGQIMNTTNLTTIDTALETARNSSIPGLFYYDKMSDIQTLNYTFDIAGENPDELRDREKLKIVVNDTRGTTDGVFTYRSERQSESLVELLATLFVLLVWFFGVIGFAGPVMTLVIIPIERMVRLLGMLMVDPLGYQSNLRFKKFLLEGDRIARKSQWTSEVLKGMETSFLMSTILRIGSLMKVGFGSAGVEIIRNNLQKGQNKNMLILNSQGSTVSCIFLFCDIRQFTDATECLQEEVFVFTNKIAAVVHSICHSYGGSANKNVGDAFLVSWQLENESSGGGHRFNSTGGPKLTAKHHQADKALLSVVKICMALHYDDYYVDTMTETARSALLTKLKNREGPIVQMGFGMHAGKAVQGAIGSQRKIDATYVSEAVERAEYLESSTKKYGLKMLMSDSFHQLLHPTNRRRCRKIDQVMFESEEDEEEDDGYFGDANGDVMELFTYDMDIDALWRHKKVGGGVGGGGGESEAPDVSVTSKHDEQYMGSTRSRDKMGPPPTRQGGSLLKKTRRISLRNFDNKGSDELKLIPDTGYAASSATTYTSKNPIDGLGSSFFDNTDKVAEENNNSNKDSEDELTLPTGPALYSSNVWLQDDMRHIRVRFTPVFFQTFTSGLNKYYKKDWVGARQCFEAITERFDDGPSKYFLKMMASFDYTPPPDFKQYGKAH